MQVETAWTRRGGLRRPLAAVVIALLVGAVLLVPARAQAMVQVGAVPSATPGSTVQAIVQNQASGTGSWIIDAPPDTTITIARSIPGPGLSPFTCYPVDGGARADCQFSGLWGANNQVAITLVVDAGSAAPQRVTGTSTIQNVESGTFSIDIVRPAAPSAPTIDAPPAGDESLGTRPTIAGTKTAGPAGTTGTTLDVTLDGKSLCTVAPSDTEMWSCTPDAPLAPGSYTVSATQTDRFGQRSPVATSTFTVLAPAGLSIDRRGQTKILAGFPSVQTIMVGNAGAGEARAAYATIDTGSLQVPVCELDGRAFDCGALPTGVDLGTVPPGGERVFRLTVAARPGTAPGTTFPIATTVRSTTAAASPVTASTDLATVRPSSPTITAPADRSSTTALRPVVRGGGAIRNATVTVRQGSDELCTATAGADGSWSCTPGRAFAIGSVTITAAQTYGGVESVAATSRFAVTRVDVPGTATGMGPSAPSAGGTGSADAGGLAAGGPGENPSVGSGTPSGGTAAGSAPSGSGAGAGNSAGAAAPAPPGSTDTGGALPMDLRFSTQRIVPGTAADMRGTLGPNASVATVAVTFSGRMSPGMVYRSVDVEVDDRRLDCRVGTTTFSCLIPLDPGAEADVGIRVYADPVNAPDTAVQQLSVRSNRDAQANALTVTTAVAKSSTEASRLADEITTFNVTEFPGAMVPLLAMLLFALAATVAGRRTVAVTGPDSTPPGAGPDTTPPGSGPEPTPSGGHEPPPAPARPTTR